MIPAAEVMKPPPCYVRISLKFALLLAMGLTFPLAAICGLGNPNKSIAYVTNGGNTDGNGSVSPIDTDTRKVVGSVS
jgi:hypothetical protein